MKKVSAKIVHNFFHLALSFIYDNECACADINFASVPGYFRIDNSTGFIYLMKELDRELINVFELVVRAYNHGSNVSRRKRDAGITCSILAELSLC